MLKIVDLTVSYLYAVLLSVGAMIALACAPPVGILMLVVLRRYLGAVAGRRARPELQIILS